jgi:DNA processing protein
METKAYWVGFNLVKGVGPVRMRSLIDYFGSLEVAWQAPSESFRSAGLPQKVVENLLEKRNSVDLAQVMEWLEKKEIQVLTWEDNTYPGKLKDIDHPPPVIYYRGTILPEDDWAVAIVGTRRMTSYGNRVAEEISGYLAQNGISVISGLARGIDAVAHKAAVNSGGRTIAVLGSGVDQIYPPEHRQLADQIMEQGAILSDYAPGTPPDSVNFPPRNRIISGLSLATVVVEAGNRSGALITATFSVEQGREVFAVPGSIYGPQSKGTNNLIQQGARPLIKVEDILEVLDINLGQIQDLQVARRMLPMDQVETNLLNLLGDEPTHVDELSVKAALPVEKVAATLTMMELKGMVRQMGGMKYIGVREDLADYD